MAIKGTADRIVLYNVSRPAATPPIVFSDLSNTAQFSFSIWAKMLDVTTPDVLIIYEGDFGSKIFITMESGEWRLYIRDGNLAINQGYPLATVSVGDWVVFCVSVNGPILNTYFGRAVTGTGQPAEILHVIHDLALPPSFTLKFNHIAIVVRNNMAVCNFKYWNLVLDLNQFIDRVHHWTTDPTLPAIWCSPMRTPGDVSNIANPHGSREWGESVLYGAIVPNSDSFVMVSDPEYLVTQPCFAWVYPIGFPNSFVNPGNTPLVTTDYKAPQFWEFADKGSVPTTPFDSITYYALPFAGIGGGVENTDTWGLFKDENGVEHFDTVNPQFRFENQPTNGTPIPGLTSTTNFYIWKYGAMFRYAGGPALPAETAFLAYMLLFVGYTGVPSGLPSLPVQDLVGLFAIRRDGVAVDQYNRGTELKIPDPTIRTAFVGE